jgi:predicted phage tail protein
LRGLLGVKYGAEWRLDVKSVAEAVHAINALKGGFFRTIAEMRDVDFGITVGERQISADALKFPNLGKTITITPVVCGSGKDLGWLEVVAGVALIAVGVVGAIYSQPWALQVILLGAGLAVGGVAALLAPAPATIGTNPDAKHLTSYQFNGPINTIEEGQPVPVLYGGPLWVGSAVVSSEIVSAPVGTSISGQGGAITGTSSSDQGPGFTGKPIA